jgi:magnesium chelatase subunit H
MYLGRKSFAFSADNLGTMEQNRTVFERLLETSDENLDMLRDLYQELEDRIEGVE